MARTTGDGVLHWARFGRESSYDLGAGSVGTTNWHYINPVTDGLEVQQNSIDRARHWGIRERLRPLAGPLAAGGRLRLEMHPEEGIALLYHALAGVITDVTGAASGYYEHCFTPAETMDSFYYEERVGESAQLLNYAGCWVDALTFTGDIGGPVFVDYDIHAANFHADRSLATPTPIWTYKDPFTGTQGSITKNGAVWTKTDNWVVRVDLGGLHRRRWGYRGWYEAGAGPVTVTVDLDLFFEDDQELKEFLGDSSHDLIAGPLAMQDGLEVIDDFVIVAQTAEFCDAGLTLPYQFQLSIPRLTWETAGPPHPFDDFNRLPLTAKAHYDPHDLYGIQVCVRNKLPLSSITPDIPPIPGPDVPVCDDFSLYTAVNGDINTTATQVTVTNGAWAQDFGLWIDKGAGSLEDFQHDFVMHSILAGTEGNGARHWLVGDNALALVNGYVVDTFYAGANIQIQFKRLAGGVTAENGAVTVPNNNTYYILITRQGANVVCDVYYDEGHNSLAGTMTLTNDETAYRYITVIDQVPGGGAADIDCTGSWTRCLQLLPAPG